MCLIRTRLVLVGASVAVKRHHDHGNSYRGKHSIEAAAYSSEVQFIIMAGSMAADMVLATS